MASCERDSYDTDGAVAPNDLTSIQNRIEATRDLLLKIAEGLGTTADRVFGAAPQLASGQCASTPMSGQMDEVMRSLDRLQSTTQSLVDVAARFHRL